MPAVFGVAVATSSHETGETVTSVLVAAASVFALPPTSVAVLTASVVLLALRIWSHTMALPLTRLVSMTLDASIGILVLLFFALVVLRFVTFA